jgi:hypothetical protein
MFAHVFRQDWCVSPELFGFSALARIARDGNHGGLNAGTLSTSLEFGFQGIHALDFAVDQAHFARNGIAPVQQFGLVGVRRKTADGVDIGFDCQTFAKQGNSVCTVYQHSAQAALGLIAYNHHAGIFA